MIRRPGTVEPVMRGLLIHDRKGAPVLFLICQLATRYYQVMTLSTWMPVLVDEVI